eukprot:Hpha_TRINITY_DN25872_c0_g1::TRINITY_DN25872_c0_g1_i1::g.19880::m.19880
MPSSPGAGGEDFSGLQDYVAELESSNRALKDDVQRLTRVLLLSPEDAEWRQGLLSGCGDAEEDEDDEKGTASTPPNEGGVSPPVVSPLLVPSKPSIALEGGGQQTELMRARLGSKRRECRELRSSRRAGVRRVINSFVTRTPPPAAPKVPLPESAELLLAEAEHTETFRRRGCDDAYGAVRRAAEMQLTRGRQMAAEAAKSEAYQAAAAASEAARVQTQEFLDTTKRELAASESSGADLRKALESERARVQSLEARVEELSKAATDSGTRIQRLESDLRAQETKRERAEQRTQEVREEGEGLVRAEREAVKRIEEVLAATTQAKEAALREIDKLIQQNEAASMQLNMERSSTAAHREKEAVQMTARGEAEKEAQIMRQSAAEKDSEIKQLRERLEMLQSRQTHERATLNAELAAAKAHAEDVEQRSTSLSEKLRAADHTLGELDSLRDRHSELDAKATELTRENVKLEAQCQALTETSAAELKQRKALEEALEAEKQESAEHARAQEEAQEQLQDVEGQARSLEQEVQELREALRDAQELNVQTKEENQTLSDRIREWDSYSYDQDEIMDRVEEWEQGIEHSTLEKMVEARSEEPQGAGLRSLRHEELLRLLNQSSGDLRRWQDYLEETRADPVIRDRREMVMILRLLLSYVKTRSCLNQYSEVLLNMQPQNAAQQQQQLPPQPSVSPVADTPR